jgi:hypothetical protein
MSFWTAIVLIVAISTLSGVLIERYKAMGRINAGRAKDAEPAADALRAAERRELEDLRERIKVLERIATDHNSSAAQETRRVAEEIEALRDRQHS